MKIIPALTKIVPAVVISLHRDNRPHWLPWRLAGAMDKP